MFGSTKLWHKLSWQSPRNRHSHWSCLQLFVKTKRFLIFIWLLIKQYHCFTEYSQLLSPAFDHWLISLALFLAIYFECVILNFDQIKLSARRESFEPVKWAG